MTRGKMLWLGDDRGQLLTLDLLLSLVPLVLVLGISANAMSGAVTQIQEYSTTYDDQRMLQDAADTLLKSPGEPPEWDGGTLKPEVMGLVQHYPDGVRYENKLSPATGKNVVIPELAWSEIISHTMYHQKFNFLVSPGNESNLYNLTGTTKTYLTISNISAGEIVNEAIGNPPPANASQIYQVERVALHEYVQSGADNITTIMLYQRAVAPADWTDPDICTDNGVGNYNCTLENSLKINFTIPNTEFLGDCFNITGNFTPYGPYNGTFNFTVFGVETNGKDMDGSSTCGCTADDDIEIDLNDANPVGDVANIVCKEMEDANVEIINAVKIDRITVTMQAEKCPPDCIPAQTRIFEIWVDIPLTTYDSNFAKLVLQTWK
jgi:hypothetical protein